MSDHRIRSGFMRPALGAAALALVASSALAQLPGNLGGGALGWLSGAGLPSVGSAGVGNTAGVLGYCVKNNYLSGGGASSVQQGLMGKLGGQSKAQSDPGFAAGSSGTLQTGGSPYSLGGASGGASGLKDQATRKVCDMVLQHGKSLL